MPDQLKLDELYLDLAGRLSLMSHARRKKVGALVVKGTNIISMGWNGTPAGKDNCCEVVDQDGSLSTKPSVLHAEWNAVQKLKALNEDGKLNGSTLYLTLSPCSSCTDLIIQNKIARVVFRETYRDVGGISSLKDEGIIVEQLEGN